MMESQKYAIVDLETTGHSPASGDRMIQIAIVIMKDWCIEKTFTSFIHPGKKIPSFIQDLTNITDEDVADALPFEAHADYIYALLEDTIFVAHNTNFDLAFLQAEFTRAGLPKWTGKHIDTVELAKILYPMALGYKLGDLANELNIPLPNAHRADDDAKATALLLKACWEELQQLPLVTLELLHKRSFRLKSHLSQLFFDALCVKRLQVAQDDAAYEFYKKLAIRKAPLPYEKLNNGIAYPATRVEKIALMSASIPNYEERPQQFQMMDIVWESLQTKQESVIEASTGIGKTLSYLLPAFYYAKQTKKKVGISTYTSHLLEQLLQEEVPKLEKLTGEHIEVALLKGIRHYVDIDRYEQILKMPDESYDETLAVLQVLIWLTKTVTGDVSELNLSGGGQLFLKKIRKQPNDRQPATIDFYARAIDKAQHAHIVVTNHAMLLADLVRQAQLFDSIGGWIVDEAHQFVQAAVQRDEKVFNYMSWKYIFGQIGIYQDEQLFYSLQRVALRKHLVPLQTLHILERRFIQMREQFDEAMQHFTQQLHYMLRARSKAEAKQIFYLHEFDIPYEKFGHVSATIQNWIDLAEQVATEFLSGVEELPREHQYIIEQWQYWIDEVKVKVSEWDEVFLATHAHYSAWLEVDTRSMPGSIHVFKRPINVTTTIEQLMNPIRERAAIIWTSGTLTVPSNERFIIDQLGIDEAINVVQLQASPDFYDGAQAFVVTDMPDVQTVHQDDYIEAVAHAITQTVRTTEGRCFVLFTSQQMLRRTVELIQESQLLDDYMLFAQGVTAGSRMRLLKSFQKFNLSVLFGTTSFWEGVDVPGDGLSSVIVVRLPFTSPDEPTFKARAQQLNATGHNAFNDLSLPEAILRFKQGFGRLIRSSHDKGVFIVLDRRIDSKSYGKEFIRALPPISVQKLPLQHMVTQLEHWYNKKDE